MVFGLFNQLAAGNEHGDAKLVIGDYCAFNSGVIINADCGGVVDIGNYVMVGPNVMFRASNHRYTDRETPIQKQGHNAGKILVEDDVWIGGHVVVLTNVTIGRGAIVAAGAVVTKDVEAFSIVAGVPARQIGVRGEGT